MGTVSGAIVASYLDRYTMILGGQKSASTYGQLLSWDSDPGAFEMMLRGTGLHPGMGLLVLEIQQKKLSFLLKCAQIILHDHPPQDIDDQGQPAIVPAPSSKEDSEWPSLVKEVLKAPYQVPDHFDVARLRSFVSAKRADAEDHIWSLREDPDYFRDTLYEWSEHRQEKLPSVNGRPHPLLRRDEFWEHILRNIVMQAYGNLIIWSQLEKDIEHLISLRQSYGDRIQPYAELPEDFAHALCHFSYQVDQSVKPAIGMWRTGMVASPPLRNHYVREPLDPNYPTRMIIKPRKQISHVEDPFLWMMDQLTRDDQVMFMGLDNILDELERLMRKDRKSRERLSPWLANVLSELSLLGELKRQVGLLWPGPSGLQAVDIEEQEKKYGEKSMLLDHVLEIFKKGMRLAAVGTPLTKYNYPSEKKRTATVTQQMQEAERYLDRFWKTVDDHVTSQVGKSLASILEGILSQRPLRRTEDWKEPERKRTDPNVHSVVKHFAMADLEQRTSNNVTPDTIAVPKQKTKTRGTPRVGSKTPKEGQGEPDLSTQDPLFTVGKRGYKVFSTLFFDVSHSEPPGELAWSDFLSAMASVGFSVQSLDGSAWVFAPLNDLFHRSIIFHEPHPSSKIPFRTARRFGRRLERAFGWTAATFARA